MFKPLSFACENTHYLLYKRLISAKSENSGAICATEVLKNIGVR